MSAVLISIAKLRKCFVIAEVLITATESTQSSTNFMSGVSTQQTLINTRKVLVFNDLLIVPQILWYDVT